MNSKPDDAGLFERRPALNGNLPEVLIQSQQNSGFRFGELKKFGVLPSSAMGPSPIHVVAVSPKHLDGRLWEIFIGKDSHLSRRKSGRNWIGLVFVSQVAGVRKAGENVVARQPRIVGQQILFGLSGGKQFENELDRKASAADHGFAGQDLRIDDDTL